MKKIILFFIFIFFTFCKKENNSQPKSPYMSLVSDDKIYNFINSALKNNDIYNSCENLLETQSEIYIEGGDEIISKLSSEFTNEDLSFIQNQYKNSNYFNFEEKRIANKNILKLNRKSKNQDYIKEFINKNGCILHLRIPLFNNNFDLAVVELTKECGILCGESGVFIYRKDENGKWELFKTIERVVS